MKESGVQPSSGRLALTWESLPWDSEPVSAGRMTRRAQLKARGPYQAAIPAKIAQASLDLPAQVEAGAEDALVEIARFDAELSQAFPSPDGTEAAELAPLAAVLLRTESSSSSQIEHITAGAKALALAAIGADARPNARRVVANVKAMESAYTLARRMDAPSVLAAHAALMANDDQSSPGCFREQPVWIGGAAPTPHTASFVPPHHSRVPGAMEDLFAFIARTDLPVLAQVAIAHAQFETIHPFTDGNGRTGRVLIHSMLHAAGTTRSLTVPVSAGLLKDTRSYFDALTLFREGDSAPIVERMTQAAFEGVHNGRLLAEDLLNLHADWKRRVRARQGATAWRLLPVIIAQPAVTTSWLADRLSVSLPTAMTAISTLVDAQVLTPTSTNKRNRTWVAKEVTDALDRFAARARRASTNPTPD